MAGESATQRARTTREKAERLLASAERWERGAEGEARTAAVLADLPCEWTVLHDVTWPGRQRANIDHVAVGPAGVFVIDSKHWSGRITAERGVLRQNGYSRAKDVTACMDSARAVATLVPDLAALCRPVICFVRDDAMRARVLDVELCTSATLLATLTTRTTVLSPEAVDATVARLRTGLAPRAGQAEPVAPAPAPAVASAPRRERSGRPSHRAPRRRRRVGADLVRLAALVLIVVVAARLAQAVA